MIGCEFSTDQVHVRCLLFRHLVYIAYGYKVLETSLPHYLSQQLLSYASTRGLRSSSFLQVPRTNFRFGSRSFRVSASTIWNSIPQSVRSCESLTTFRKRLKTLYFQLAFSAAPSDLLLRFNLLMLALYKSTYLLTYISYL